MPSLLQAHLQFTQSRHTKLKLQKSLQASAQGTHPAPVGHNVSGDTPDRRANVQHAVWRYGGLKE